MLFPTLKGKRVGQANLNRWAELWLRQRHSPPPKKNPLLDPAHTQEMIDHFQKLLQLDWSYGGYLENRSVLWRGSYLAAGRKYMHLGVDFNAPAGTPVAVDTNVQVIVVDDDTPLIGGWGPRVMLKVAHQDIVLIYAHLAGITCKVGDTLRRGDVFAAVGPSESNGRWYPHVHVQAMTLAARRYYDDQPDELDGYGSEDDIGVMRSHFPNPMDWVRVT